MVNPPVTHFVCVFLSARDRAGRSSQGPTRGASASHHSAARAQGTRPAHKYGFHTHGAHCLCPTAIAIAWVNPVPSSRTPAKSVPGYIQQSDEIWHVTRALPR